MKKTTKDIHVVAPSEQLDGYDFFVSGTTQDAILPKDRLANKPVESETVRWAIQGIRDPLYAQLKAYVKTEGLVADMVNNALKIENGTGKMYVLPQGTPNFTETPFEPTTNTFIKWGSAVANNGHSPEAVLQIEAVRQALGTPASKFDVSYGRSIAFRKNDIVAEATLKNVFQIGDANVILDGYYFGFFRAAPRSAGENLLEARGVFRFNGYTSPNGGSSFGPVDVPIFEGAILIAKYENNVLTAIDSGNSALHLEQLLQLQTSADNFIDRDFDIYVEPANLFIITGRGVSKDEIVQYDVQANYVVATNTLSITNNSAKKIRFNTIDVIVNNYAGATQGGVLKIKIPREFHRKIAQTVSLNGAEFFTSPIYVQATNMNATESTETEAFEQVSPNLIRTSWWIDKTDVNRPMFLKIENLDQFGVRVQLRLDFGG